MIRGFTVYNFQFVLLSFSEDRFFLSRQYSTDEMLQNALRDYVLLDTLKIIILTNNPANKLQQGVTKEFKFPSVSSSVHPSDCSSVRISTINILLVFLWSSDNCESPTLTLQTPQTLVPMTLIFISRSSDWSQARVVELLLIILYLMPNSFWF